MFVSSWSSCETVVAFRYVEVGVNAVEQALEIGAIARSLYLALSRTDCLCVETEEYKQYNITREKYLAETYPDASRRELQLRRLTYFFEHPFEGKEVEKDCDRCLAMKEYEDFIGEDDVGLYVHGVTD
jgi:hypothetical protein